MYFPDLPRKAVHGGFRSHSRLLPHIFRVRNIRFQHLAADYGHTPEVVYGVLTRDCVAAFDHHKRSWRVNTALIVSDDTSSVPVASALSSAS